MALRAWTPQRIYALPPVGVKNPRDSQRCVTTAWDTSVVIGQILVHRSADVGSIQLKVFKLEPSPDWHAFS
jgi:hypothetical protein